MPKKLTIPLMSEYVDKGESPEILFWVGCAGSYDARAQKVTLAFCKILNQADIKFAILGQEESCTGDHARRAGNEFIFQIAAQQNIAVLNTYNVKNIVTTCPHCFNVIKNEYPELGGNYDVIHHTQYLQKLIDSGRLKLKKGSVFEGKKITYHDSCYLGRANGEYQAPRSLLETLNNEMIQMPRAKEKALCCGGGGAQVFKEDETGDRTVNFERSKEAIETGAQIIAMNCPFCMIMYNDGLKSHGKEEEVMVYDLAELVVNNIDN